MTSTDSDRPSDNTSFHVARAVTGDAASLGWVDRCDRCHMPTRWNQAQVNE